MSDEYLYNTSLDEKLNTHQMLDKEYLYINDSNNNAYQGSIVFDSTQLSNSGRWLAASEAVIQIPYVIAFRSTVDITGAVNAYCVGLKSGTHHIVDSIDVQLQNRSVVQLQQQINNYVSYKVMSSWSQDDLDKWGPLTYVCPDSAGSTRYAAAASVHGVGICNNLPYSPVVPRTYAVTDPLHQQNDGLAKRLEMSALTIANGVAVATTAAQLNAGGQSYFANDGGAAAARIYQVNILATIRMKDLCDLFKELPLMRGAQWRITINYNSARLTILSAAGAQGVMSITSSTQLSGNTVPFMISSGLTGEPMAGVIGLAEQTITIEGNVLRTSSPVATNPLMSACRMYFPAYKLDYDYEAEYLAQGRKYVQYTDVYMNRIQAVGAGASFNALITNGIVNPRYLVIVPLLTATGTNNGPAVLDQARSPFDSAPATTCPDAQISRFQVLLSGKAVYQEDVSYTWQEFTEEVARVNALYGGNATGLTSGLLTKEMFDRNYRFYVCDLSRRPASEDVVPQSIQVSGINDTSKIMDYLVYVVYGKSLEFDIASGKVLE